MVALKMCAPGRAHIERHYDDLKKKVFFKDLVDYMCSGPIVCMVWEGLGAVKCGRMMLGETNPQDPNLKIFENFLEKICLHLSSSQI